MVNAFKGWQHQGINMTVSGRVHLSSSARGVGILDSLAANVKPITLFRSEMSVTPAGKFADGVTEVPFNFTLSAPGVEFIESYHGVFVSVIYSIMVVCERGVFSKSLAKEIEFIVEVPSKKMPDPEPRSFNITPESLDQVDQTRPVGSIPKFKSNSSITIVYLYVIYLLSHLIPSSAARQSPGGCTAATAPSTCRSRARC
jgi:hypothetical protein